MVPLEPIHHGPVQLPANWTSSFASRSVAAPAASYSTVLRLIQQVSR